MYQSDEIAAVSRSICQSTDRLINSLDGLSADELTWKPPAEGANSIFSIVSHVLAAQEGLILGRVFGQPIEPRERAGWTAEGNSAEPLHERWNELRGRIESTLEAAPPSTLTREVEHPRIGKMTGWEMLLLVNRHNAEHIGHAELTRDLAKAAGV